MDVNEIRKWALERRDSASRDYDVTGDTDSAAYYEGIMDVLMDLLMMIDEGK